MISYAHASRRITSNKQLDTKDPLQQSYASGYSPRNPNRGYTELESTSPPNAHIRENKEESHVSLEILKLIYGRDQITVQYWRGMHVAYI